VLFGRSRESRSREVRFVHPQCGTAGAGIWPEQCPGKCAAEKGHLRDSARIGKKVRTRVSNDREKRRVVALNCSTLVEEHDGWCEAE
jgi:hypothetical protein